MEIKKREEIDNIYKWDLSKIFKSDKIYLNEIKEVKKELPLLENYKETMLKNAKCLYEADRKTEPNLSDIPTTTEDIFDYCPRCGMRVLSKWYKPTTEDCSLVDPLHDDCFDCDKFFTCDNKGDDYKTDCAWKKGE